METASNDTMSRVERLQETASGEMSIFESFDPNKPVDAYHVADVKKLLPSQFHEYAVELGRRLVPEWLVDALEHGIAVRHAGINHRYHQACEMLF